MAWIAEREAIRIKKDQGQPPPYTKDSILSKYRFCNVHREDDAVTRWITLQWRQKHPHDPDLWFAMLVARHINLPSTLAELGYPVPWNPQLFKDLMVGRKLAGQKSYNAAYMIRAGRQGPKHEYLADQVFTPLWEKREELRPRLGDTLDGFHARLQAQYGLGSFMAAQVVADVKYVGPLVDATDWWTFAASGPGSRRGLNRVLGRDPKAPSSEPAWRSEMVMLSAALERWFKAVGMHLCHAQDLQNCLCEFDKYERARLGQGRPKRRFP